MLSEGLEIEISDFEAQHLAQKGDYLRQVCEIVIVGLPTILEVCFMCWFMSLGRIPLQDSVTTNLFNAMEHHLALRKVEVSIKLIGNLNHAADLMPKGVHFAPVLGRPPSFSIRFLVYLSLLHEFLSQCIGIGLHLFAGSPEQGNIFEGLKLTQGFMHEAHKCIIVRFISSLHIEFSQCQFALNCVMEYGVLSQASAWYKLGYISTQVPAHFLHLLPIPLRTFLIGRIFWYQAMLCRHR
jgi:hypothetical protein